MTELKLKTPFANYPKIINDNFLSAQRYVDVFYDGSVGIIIKPVETTGRIKGTRGEFVTAVVDNLIVKKQYTNLLENSTTVDYDYYSTYINAPATRRDASTTLFENTNFKYIDVISPYYKIWNDVSIAFNTSTLGQQIEILFDVSIAGRPFNIMLDPSINGSFKTLSITATDSSMANLTLISVEYDASWGTSWAIRNRAGNFTIK